MLLCQAFSILSLVFSTLITVTGWSCTLHECCSYCTVTEEATTYPKQDYTASLIKSHTLQLVVIWGGAHIELSGQSFQVIVIC